VSIKIINLFVGDGETLLFFFGNMHLEAIQSVRSHLSEYLKTRILSIQHKTARNGFLPEKNC